MSQVQNLFPAGFLETGSCEGPRLTRSQPSRESAGVLLNECESKYTSEFQLPYRNIATYLKSLKTSWVRLTDEQKQMISQDILENIPWLCNGNAPVSAPISAPISAPVSAPATEQFTNSNLAQFLNNNLGTDTNKNTKELLDALYRPNDEIKTQVPEKLRSDIRRAFYEWTDHQTLWYHTNYRTGIFLFLLILLFFLLGIGIMQTSNTKQR